MLKDIIILLLGFLIGIFALIVGLKKNSAIFVSEGVFLSLICLILLSIGLLTGAI